MSDYECPRCKTEYCASGSHDDDSREHECEECEFRFRVNIEYEPSYDTSCVTHHFGEPKRVNGSLAQFCVYCGAINPDSVVASR